MSHADLRPALNLLLWIWQLRALFPHIRYAVCMRNAQCNRTALAITCSAGKLHLSAHMARATLQSPKNSCTTMIMVAFFPSGPRGNQTVS